MRTPLNHKARNEQFNRAPLTLEEQVGKFDVDVRAYLEARIAFAEVQEPYQALSSEDEIKWLQEYITEAITVAENRGFLKGKLEERIKSIGKTRTHQATQESIDQTVAVFNEEHGTEFTVLNKDHA